MSNIAIVPIGGVGNRMKKNSPKQFLKVNGKSLYLYTLEKFEKNKSIDKIVIACLDGYQEFVKKECQKYNISKVTDIVTGGKTQLESIFNCLIFMKDNMQDNDKIIIHVGNRPNVSQKLITKSIKSYDSIGALSTVVPEIEVMIEKKQNKVIPRDSVVRIQTPQVFSYHDLKELINDKEKYKNEASTMCDLFIKLNKKITFIDGELLNFKITYPEDLELFEKLIS